MANPGALTGGPHGDVSGVDILREALRFDLRPLLEHERVWPLVLGATLMTTLGGGALGPVLILTYLIAQPSTITGHAYPGNAYDIGFFGLFSVILGLAGGLLLGLIATRSVARSSRSG